MSGTPSPHNSVYARLGGEPAVRALVERFCALMDVLPEAQGIRRLHPPSLQRSADCQPLRARGGLCSAPQRGAPAEPKGTT
jgi:truncated hemoglobin YjbI